MLRKFRININGKEYIVEMEEIGTVQQLLVSSPTPQMIPVVQEAPIQVASVPTSVVSEGLTMVAPMPGNVLSVHVKLGDSVVENQVIIVLEAMKMENEIVAPKAGIVRAIYVESGKAIDVGKPIVTIV